MQNKLVWVDNLKALGILAVILGHIASPLGGFIFSWHMPLFFMVAGFFIRFDLSFKNFIAKDFKRLIIPYFIFAILGLILEIVKRYLLHRDSLNIFDELQGIFIWMDMTSLIHTYAFVLWFLPSLFFAKIIFYVVHKYITNLFLQFIAISLLFALSFMVDLPFGFDNSMNAVVFIFIGNLFYTRYQNNKLLYMLPFVLVGLYVFFGVPALDMATKDYSNIFVNILFASSIIYTFVMLFKKVSIDSKLLKIWGGNTMLLFIVHPYTNNIASIVVEKLHFGDWYLKFFISVVLLQIILVMKLKFENRGLFKYV